MFDDNDEAHLREVRSRTLATLREALGDARDVAILDAPNQRNVGDSLIWEGELAYLKSLGVNLRYVADLKGYDARDVRSALPAGGVILLHGGGNFGDLWQGHQMHRERIVRELPDYRIVQLSQSIFFSSESRAEQAHDLLRKHPDFHVLIRDELSMERARQMLPDLRVTYCPDMALGFSPTVSSGAAAPDRSVLVIARADKEAASGLAAVAPDWLGERDVQVTDWGRHAADARRWKNARAVARLHHLLIVARRRLRITPVLPRRVTERAIRTINQVNVQSAVDLYAGAPLIVVDRLHAHVLAALLGIPHVALDNNYRKIGSVFDEYTGRFSTAHYAHSIDEAREVALAELGGR